MFEGNSITPFSTKLGHIDAQTHFKFNEVMHAKHWLCIYMTVKGTFLTLTLTLRRISVGLSITWVYAKS